MKNKIANLLQLLSTVSLFSLAFYAFTQTSIFNLLITGLQMLCTQIPLLRSYESFLPSIFTILLYVMILLVGIFGGKGKLNLVYYFSLLLYIPVAFTFSAVNWLEILGVGLPLESFLSFNQVLLVGIALITCRLFLINLSRIRKQS